MNLEDWRQVFAVVGVFLVLGASIPMIVRLLPPRVESFTALAILGENGMAEDYYPNRDFTIRLGQPVKWHVYLYNHEGGAAYLLVRVKILGLDSTPPNSSSCLASPAPSVYEFSRVLRHNETVILPFVWAIIDAEDADGRLDVDGILVNGHYVSPHLSFKNSTLRFVFELWVYDEGSNMFRFDLDDGSRCVWNQIWFNLALSA